MIEPSLLKQENIDALQELEPCGVGCPGPAFCIEDLTVEHMTEVGGGKHLRLRLRYGKRPGEFLNGIFFSTDSLQSGVAVGDRVDVAFVPQINEYRDVRSVQLNLLDIRPCEQTRRESRAQSALYLRYRQQSLSAHDATQLLPIRSEFVAVWRYLISHADQSSLEEDFACLSRKILRSTNTSLTMAKTRICLDVFAEQGLIELHKHGGHFEIRINNSGQKVDLNASEIIRALKRRRDNTEES